MNFAALIILHLVNEGMSKRTEGLGVKGVKGQGIDA
jgi:hypothetical protein